jgi:hypothetical protein
MKTTGYALREAIKQHELRKDTAAGAFDGSLKMWPGENKEPPTTIVDTFLRAEAAIAKLQTVQAKYNLTVQVEFDGRKMPLSEAIKLIGGIARVEKMWRSVAAPKKDRYGYDRDERQAGVTVAVATMTSSEAVKLAQAAAKRAGALRATIATANAQEVEIENLDLSLFE